MNTQLYDIHQLRQKTGVFRDRKQAGEVLAKVLREEFVPEPLRPWAYANKPLPVAFVPFTGELNKDSKIM